MAKQQTFLDKSSKKGGGADLISVKVIMAERTEHGTVKFNERFVKVADLNDVEKTMKQALSARA